MRLVHIPFWPISVGDTTGRTVLEENLRIACENASSSIGVLISMAQTIKSEEFRKMLYDCYIPLVIKELPQLSYRVHKSYALVLNITNAVS